MSSPTSPKDSPEAPEEEPTTQERLADLPEDFEVQMLKLLCMELLNRLSDPKQAAEMSASEMQLIRQLCQDNSVDFSQIKRGDFGEVAQKAAEEYPFPQGQVVN